MAASPQGPGPTLHILTLSVRAREGGRSWRSRRSRGALAPLIANARRSLWARRARWTPNALSLWTLRTIKKPFIRTLHAPRPGLYLLIAPEVEVAFETYTSPAYHRAPFAGDMVLGQRDSPKASQCFRQKLGLCDAPPLGSAQRCSKLWDSSKRTTMRHKTRLACQPHAHRGSQRLPEAPRANNVGSRAAELAGLIWVFQGIQPSMMCPLTVPKPTVCEHLQEALGWRSLGLPEFQGIQGGQGGRVGQVHLS